MTKFAYQAIPLTRADALRMLKTAGLKMPSLPSVRYAGHVSLDVGAGETLVVSFSWATKRLSYSLHK